MFGAGIGAMRAEGIEQGDLLARDPGQAVKQPGNQAVVRRGAGDVGEDDANAAAGFSHSRKGRAPMGFSKRRQHSAALIGQAGRCALAG